MTSIMTPTSAVFDKTTFLKRMMNDWDLCLEVLEDFLADLPFQLERLEQAFAQGDLPALAQRAHTIKGASSNVSALVLQQSAATLELAARNGDLDKTGVCLTSLLEAAQKTESTLASVRHSSHP
jgi:HPt (histidine-containing phosphotransfer) domain-containing protein